jgi:type III pantothenate kinase
MILVDIGNTSLHFARNINNKIKNLAILPTAKASRGRIIKIIRPFSGDNILICSVVPKVSAIFKKLKRKVFIVGKDVKVPIKSFYNKKQIGMDRLLAAYAAGERYPGTRIIIDFGTAITFDILSKRGDYQGGLILPGIGSTLRVLENCALLPKKIKIKKSVNFIPRNTSESINKGMKKGFLAMINGLMTESRAELR